MSEMIERVAIAIHNYRPKHKTLHWSNCVDSYKSELRLQAKSAIEAMREPTQNMVDRGETAFFDSGTFEVEDGWKRMIDDALKE